MNRTVATVYKKSKSVYCQSYHVLIPMFIRGIRLVLWFLQEVMEKSQHFIHMWTLVGFKAPRHLDKIHPIRWRPVVHRQGRSQATLYGTFKRSEQLSLYVVCCIQPIPHLPQNNSHTVDVGLEVVPSFLKKNLGRHIHRSSGQSSRYIYCPFRQSHVSQFHDVIVCKLEIKKKEKRYYSVGPASD